MKRPQALIAQLLAIVLAALSAHAQQGGASMNPSKEEGGKNPFGVNLLGGERPKDAKTEITATKQATFDNATSVAEFEGKVVVRDPQFTLFCDRLKVTLKKDRKGLALVEAFDNVVIVQENKGEGGQKVKSIGRAGKAVYNPDTGQVTLTTWPQIQHGINNQVATEQGTVMTLGKDGKSQTIGGSKTVIVDSGDAQL